jgi:ParB family chromosome partitioning protein
MPRNALGKGLGALIREPQQEPTVPQPLQQPERAVVPQAAGTAAAVAPARIPAQTEGLLQLDIDLIDPSPYQPRSRFREEALEELAQSIRVSGIVQPLVVRHIAQRFQLIAGERRWRAAQRAGLMRVPAVVREVSEETALEMTLVENLQREDLNPIEQAHAFEKLTEEFHLTQEQIAERTGKDRATIANALRLLKLEDTIKDLLEEGRVTAGHGRALLAVADGKLRLALAKRIARGGMTVRQVERIAARSQRPKTASLPIQHDANTKAAVEELQHTYGTRVHVRPSSPGHPGQLIFEYYDSSDLTRIYEQLMRE